MGESFEEHTEAPSFPWVRIPRNALTECCWVSVRLCEGLGPYLVPGMKKRLGRCLAQRAGSRNLLVHLLLLALSEAPSSLQACGPPRELTLWLTFSEYLFKNS